MEFALALMGILSERPAGATAAQLAEETGRSHYTVLHTLERLRRQLRVHGREKPRRIRFLVKGVERQTETRFILWTITEEGERRLRWKPRRK